MCDLINEDNLRAFVNECINEMTDTMGEHTTEYDHDDFITEADAEEVAQNIVDDLDIVSLVAEALSDADLSEEIERGLPDEVARDYQVEEVQDQLNDVEELATDTERELADLRELVDSLWSVRLRRKAGEILARIDRFTHRIHWFMPRSGR